MGLTGTSSEDVIRRIERGLTFNTLRKLEAFSGVGAGALGSAIGISERTLARRRTAGRLSPEESERLLRISSVIEKAVGLFDRDVCAAVSWLTSPKAALVNHSPLEYSRTELGAREVESLIGRLEHGVFS